MIFESDLDVLESASEIEDDICDAGEKQAVDATCDWKSKLEIYETEDRFSVHEHVYPFFPAQMLDINILNIARGTEQLWIGHPLY